MDQISVLAAAGMQSRMQSLDIVANNMANSSTGGYKSDGEFYTVFTSEAADADGEDVPTTVPMIQRQWTDFAQGLLEPTNNPLDFGFPAKAFSWCKGPSGPLYTRNGNFKLRHRNPGHRRRLPAAGPKRPADHADADISRWRSRATADFTRTDKWSAQVQLVEFKEPGAVYQAGR